MERLYTLDGLISGIMYLLANRSANVQEVITWGSFNMGFYGIQFKAAKRIVFLAVTYFQQSTSILLMCSVEIQLINVAM